MAVEQMDGVRKAQFSWEEARGVVTYDTARTSIDAVIEELHRMTGYDARVIGEADGPCPGASMQPREACTGLPGD